MYAYSVVHACVATTEPSDPCNLRCRQCKWDIVLRPPTILGITAGTTHTKERT